MLTFTYLHCQAPPSMFCRGRYRNFVDRLIEGKKEGTGRGRRKGRGGEDKEKREGKGGEGEGTDTIICPWPRAREGRFCLDFSLKPNLNLNAV